MKKIVLTTLAVVMIFLLSNRTSVLGQYQPNPTSSDCWAPAGPAGTDAYWNSPPVAAPCKPYVDIVGSEVSMSGGSYNGTIVLAGNVPSTTNTSSVWIEWDIMIDSDRNPATNEWCTTPCTTIYSSATNGIGVDYVVRYGLQGIQGGGEIFDGRTGNWVNLSTYNVARNEIQLYWNPSDIGGPTVFNFVVLVRVYGNGGASNSMELFDKAPNSGYYQFQGGNVSAVPELTMPSIVAFLATMISIGLVKYRKKNGRTLVLK